VLAASNEKKLLSAINVDGREMDGPNLGAPIYSTPVVANGVIYVASNYHLYAFHDFLERRGRRVPRVDLKQAK